MKYFQNRQSTLTVNEEIIEEAFKAIADAFSYEWLSRLKGEHSLQQLWNRKDVLATNELFFFGSCLAMISSIDHKWTTKQVRSIKQGSFTDQLGSFFEINALGMFAGSDSQKIYPTKGNNPGFDGIIELPVERKIRLSLKNYGISAHNKDFAANCSMIENKIKSLLVEKKIESVFIIIDVPRGFPEKKDWKMLSDNLSNILDHYDPSKAIMLSIDDFWAVVLNTLNDKKKFSKAHSSYSLIISCNYHKNEEKNLLDKLNEACYNLTKHSQIETDNLINFVMIHLPESASILKCSEWVEAYFDDYPEKPITGVILYQPSVANDLVKDKNFINHCFQLVYRNRKLDWFKTDETITFNLPVGIISNEPSKNMIVVEMPSGEREEVNIHDKYIYQRGNHYVKMSLDESGGMTGYIKNGPSGVFTHLVVSLEEGGEMMAFSSHYQPEDKLLIL